MSDAEQTIRDYFEWLRDADMFIDTKKVEETRRLLQGSVDPVERLRLRVALRQAEQPPDLTDAFLSVAREWAEANNVTREDFELEGVPEDVLKRLYGKTLSKGRGKRRLRFQGDIEAAVRDFVKNHSGPVTAQLVAEKLSVHDSTTRSRLRALVDQGLVKEDGVIKVEGAARGSTAYVWAGGEV